MACKALLASILLSLLLCSYAAETLNSVSSGRSLLQRSKRRVTKRRTPAKTKTDSKPKQTTKEEPKGKTSTKRKGKDKAAEAEAKREAAALKAYEKEKERREKEKRAVLKRARKEAPAEVTKFRKAATEKQQVGVFVNLWKNAKGPTILIVLTTLMNSDKKKSPKFVRVVADSMVTADRQGYSFQISDGLWQALTLVEREEDGGPLLQAVLVNLRLRNNAKKGSGCVYVKNLFTDAEALAIENRYEVEFTRSFDAPEYIALAECFYSKCDREALKCCKDKKAAESGRCGCLKKEPNTCAFNLFLNTPRPIWRCNGEGCKVAKCLCPVIQTKKPKTGKAQAKSKTLAKKPAKMPVKTPPKKPTKPKTVKRTRKRVVTRGRTPKRSF